MSTLQFLRELFSSWIDTGIVLFALSFWFKSGTSSIVVNGSGQPIQCANCPCGAAGCTACPQLATTLHLTISGSGTSCAMDGTYPLTYDTGKNIWEGQVNSPGDLQFICPSSGTDPCTFQLNVYYGLPGTGTLLYSVQNCGSVGGTWASASCSTPNWTSNPTNNGTTGCNGPVGTATLTVGA